MTTLYDEITKRFPEIRSKITEDDKDNPYMLMIELAEWLKKLPKKKLTPEIIDRVILFSNWCFEHPRGKDAGDDILTIFTVSFLEHLFDSDRTRSLLPKIITRDDLVTNADYYRTWVGADNYEKALKLFAP
jgi:hypothetical protein